jgi:putative two-component system response regulator
MPARNEYSVLLIDDSPEILDTLSLLLRPDYTVLAARTGLAGLDIASRRPQPHLILLDVLLPDLDGYAVLARLRENPLTRDIPVILLTSLTDPESEEYGLKAGASDFISKPVRPNVLKARVRVQIEARQAREWLKDVNAELASGLEHYAAERDLMQSAAISALAKMAETRDDPTGQHALRVQNFVWLLAKLLCDHPRFRETLTPGYIDLLVQLAPLHDVGKLGVPDQILVKRQPLDDDEHDIMQSHTILGCETMEKVERDLGRSARFIELAKEITRSHHEEWDGAGYPDGLAGDAIPISARLVSLADAFDGEIFRRPGREPKLLDEAREAIASARGIRFDPDVTDAFLDNFDEFVEIVEKYPEID